jgi:diaminopropionate ammonia-lyase
MRKYFESESIVTKPLPLTSLRLLQNSNAGGPSPYPLEFKKIFSLKAHRSAFDVVRSWPGYQRTPVHSLGGLPREAGVSAIYYKDESERFGLNSFKALGGAFGDKPAIGGASGVAGEDLIIA